MVNDFETIFSKVNENNETNMITNGLLLTNQKIDYGSIFNLGTGSQYSLKEVVDLTLKLTDSKVKPMWNTMQKRKWDQISWEADINKIKNFFGCEPKNNLEKGLSKTINWHKQYYKN